MNPISLPLSPSPSLSRLRSYGAAGLAAVALAGCSASGPGTAAHTRPALSAAAESVAQRPAPTCAAAGLPAGFRPDPAHTGPLTATTYSPSADVQAALTYDQLQRGERQVFVHRSGRRVDAVASCMTLTFPSVAQADRFFGSYRTLRQEAGSLVTRTPFGRRVAGLREPVAYVERQQSFRGYRISSTTVREAAGRSGSTLDIASISGPPASRRAVTRLVTELAGGSR